MEQDILDRFESQDKKLDAIQHTVNRIYKQLFWKSVINTILFLLPLIGIAISVPWLINILSSVPKVP